MKYRADHADGVAGGSDIVGANDPRTHGHRQSRKPEAAGHAIMDGPV